MLTSSPAHRRAPLVRKFPVIAPSAIAKYNLTMTKGNSTEETRIFDEALEMAQALQGHALISKQDMARLLQLIEKRGLEAFVA
jgi:hypothetical protein